jgi:predicted phage baseplate assembly protein
LGENPAVEGSLEVYVQGGASYSKWRQIQNLVDANPFDQVFTVTSDGENNLYVNFGDGVSGAIPVNFAEIRVLYVVGGGVLGNVTTGVLTNIDYVPGLSTNDLIALQALITVTNDEVGFGGSEPESLAEIRYAAPLTLRANNRAITLQDFNSLALGVTNCGKANATSDIWTSVTLYVAPSRNEGDPDLQPGLDDNGDPTIEYDTLAADVETALTPSLLIGTSLTVQPPVYVDIVLTVQYAKQPQYTTAEVEASIKSVLTTFYGYYYNTFGQTIYVQDIETTLNNDVTGIKIAKLVNLHRPLGTGLNTLVGAADEIFRIKEENISIGLLT